MNTKCGLAAMLLWLLVGCAEHDDTGGTNPPVDANGDGGLDEETSGECYGDHVFGTWELSAEESQQPDPCGCCPRQEPSCDGPMIGGSALDGSCEDNSGPFDHVPGAWVAAVDENGCWEWVEFSRDSCLMTDR